MPTTILFWEPLRSATNLLGLELYVVRSGIFAATAVALATVTRFLSAGGDAKPVCVAITNSGPAFDAVPVPNPDSDPEQSPEPAPVPEPLQSPQPIVEKNAD